MDVAADSELRGLWISTMSCLAVLRAGSSKNVFFFIFDPQKRDDSYGHLLIITSYNWLFLWDYTLYKY